MERILKYLQQAIDEDASDVFFIAGDAVSIKKDGEIVPITDKE